MTEDDDSTDARGGRTVAEWTTFVVSSAVLALVVVLIVVQAMAATDPAAPSAQIGSVVPIGDRSGVHVTVRNEGDETAANVQVSAELVVDGETETGDLSVDFLAGGEEQELVFVFDGDPREGDLTVEVTGFEDP